MYWKYGQYNKVRDIYSVPCATYIGGKKAVRVVNDKAYIQYADGMRIYKHNVKTDMWECIQEIHAQNC